MSELNSEYGATGGVQLQSTGSLTIVQYVMVTNNADR